MNRAFDIVTRNKDGTASSVVSVGVNSLTEKQTERLKKLVIEAALRKAKKK